MSAQYCKVQIFQPQVQKCLVNAVFIIFFCLVDVFSLSIENCSSLPRYMILSDTIKTFFSYPENPIFKFFPLSSSIRRFFDNFFYLLPSSSFYKGIKSINYIVIRPYVYCPVSLFCTYMASEVWCLFCWITWVLSVDTVLIGIER